MPTGDMIDPSLYVSGGASTAVGPLITRTGDLVTRIDYDDGSYKVFSYTGSRLDRIDYVHGGATTRKDLVYSAGLLVEIVQTEI